MTNEEAKQQAEKIVNGVWHRRRANDDIASRYLTAMLIEAIAQALAVPAGCVRDENGVDYKLDTMTSYSTPALGVFRKMIYAYIDTQRPLYQHEIESALSSTEKGTNA